MLGLRCDVDVLWQVCECQIHFARMDEGNKTEMPHFASQRGPEIVRGLLEVESVFMRNLNMLRDVKHTILDVKATSWHDDYNKFRAGMKDLEVMMQNTISSAFETITTVEGGIEVLDVFMDLSSREVPLPHSSLLFVVINSDVITVVVCFRRSSALSTRRRSRCIRCSTTNSTPSSAS